METKVTSTASKLSLLVTFSLTEDRPGIIETIVNILNRLGWNVERCWSGESSIILSDNVHGMLRVSKMFSEKGRTASLVTIEYDIKSKIEAALNRNISKKITISVVELNPTNRFRFAAQIEVADRRGVVKDVLKTIYQPGIYANDKEVCFRLEGLLFLPVHVGEGKGHYIMDARFWALEDEELNNFGLASDIAAANIPELEICERISTLLKTISGVRRWNILATHQRTKAIIDQNTLNAKFKNHIYKKIESIVFEGKFYGSFPGTAQVVAEDIFNQGYTINRAIISESPEGHEKRHLGIFWGEPALAGSDIFPPTPASITDAIERHRAKTRQREQPSESGRFTANVKGRSYTISSNEAEQDQGLTYSLKLWISCQIEIKYGSRNLSKILSILTDSSNPTGQPLNIEHFINLFLYNKNRDNQSSSDKNVLVEFLCSSTSDENKNNDKLAEDLNNWLFDRIWKLNEVLSVSCKPVRTYARTLKARFESRPTQDTPSIECEHCGRKECKGRTVFPPSLPEGVEEWQPTFINTITSLADMLKITRELQASQGEGENGRLYYRGERRIFEDLLPSLLVATRKSENKLFNIHGAENLLDLQLKLLQHFQRYVAQHHFDASVQRPENFLEWLCMTQHHTLPTLLLDWSLNPLVSLFFAFDDPCGNDQGKDGQIWIMRLKPKTDCEPLTIYLGNETVKPGYEKLGGDPTLTGQDGGNFNKIKDPSPLLIVPRILTKRIEAQSGHFIFSQTEEGLNKIKDDKALVTPWQVPLLRYLVPACCKELIREEIRNLRIHEGTMYADLDAYARFLRNGGL